MQNTEKSDVPRESSLLLQPPGSFYSWNNLNASPIFMPVAVDKIDEGKEKTEKDQRPISQVNAPLFSPNISKKQDSIPTSLSQPEQNLLPSKSPSHVQHPSPSTASFPSESSYSDNSSYQSVSVPEDVSCPLSSIPANITTTSYYANSPATVETFHYSSHPPVLSTTVATVPLVSSTINSTVLSANTVANQERNTFTSTQQSGWDAAARPLDALANGITCCNYKVVEPHWFYKKVIENRDMWFGFSDLDSKKIEDAYQKGLQQTTHEDVISTDGGRYDVYLRERVKRAVYWKEKDIHVQRCTWFYKSEGLQRALPYEEATSLLLEDLYRKCVISGNWQQKLVLEGGEVIVMEGPRTILHYAHGLDVWPTIADTKSNVKIVIRGVPDEVLIDPDEPNQIDHLVFIVQGIGSVCDLRFRTVSQCVDGFREIANRLMTIHFKQEIEARKVGRIEFLPLAWHASIHTDHMGLDKRMQSITLPSIPKLRHFTNDTLLDILLYSSPLYCQAIMDTVGNELNKLYNLFISRNPHFCGNVSVAGHSLGSLILFDILANQPASTEECINLKSESTEYSIKTEVLNDPVEDLVGNQKNENDTDVMMSIETVLSDLGLQEYLHVFLKEKIDLETLIVCNESELKDLGLPLGPRKKLLSFIEKEKVKLESNNTEQLAVSVAEQCVLEDKSQIKSHPASTVNLAYAASAVYPISAAKSTISSITFPRLVFNPVCFFALGSPISMFLAVRGFETISEDFQFPTCPAFFHIFHPYDPVAFRVEPLIDPNFKAKPVLIPHHKGRKRMHIEIKENIAKMGSEIKQKLIETLRYTWDSLSVFAKAHNFPAAAVEAEVDKLVEEQMSTEHEEENQTLNTDIVGENLKIGRLNGGRRIDYVLQEKPIEALNEYIFALTSHATYWDSEDTVLMILKEVYASQGIVPMPLLSEKENKVSNFLPGASVSSPTVASKSFDSPVFYNSPYITNTTTETHSFAQLTPVADATVPVQPNLLPSPGVTNFSHSHCLEPGNTGQISNAPVQPIGPPPLSGFVRKSPFSKS